MQTRSVTTKQQEIVDLINNTPIETLVETMKLFDIPKELQTEEICMAYLKKDGRYADKHVRIPFTEEMVYAAYNHSIEKKSFHIYVRPELRSSRVLRAMFSSDYVDSNIVIVLNENNEIIYSQKICDKHNISSGYITYKVIKLTPQGTASIVSKYDKLEYCIPVSFMNKSLWEIVKYATKYSTRTVQDYVNPLKFPDDFDFTKSDY